LELHWSKKQNIETTKVRPISGLSRPGGIEIKAHLMAGKDDFAKS